MTSKNQKNIAGSNLDYVGATPSAGGFDLPSFWQAVCRYRERHGLTDGQTPILDDVDLANLRDPQPGRDFSFDCGVFADDDDSNFSSSSPDPRHKKQD